MRRLPASPSRTQALIEFEPILLDQFQRHTVPVHAELRDSMHYALFSVPDRFCASAAWLIARRLGVESSRFSSAACAIETVRCALELKFKPAGTTASRSDRFIEPAAADAASFALIPLAFEMVLGSEARLTESERCATAAVLARTTAPFSLFSVTHREARLARERHSISFERLREFHLEKVSPAFEASGETLAVLAPQSAAAASGALGHWFRKLGLFALWVDEFTSSHPSPLALTNLMTVAETMDLIKSLEAELLARAKELDFRDAAHDVIEPLGEVLKARLQ